MPGRAPLPAWYDDLSGSLDAAWSLLETGVTDRDAPAHHPLIATAGLDGAPQARVMILRAADRNARIVRVHTDWRSDKVAELRADPRLAATVYDPAAKVQLRLTGRASVHHADAVAEAAWQASQRMSRVCYGTAPASGAVIDEGGSYALPNPADEAELSAGYANFAAIVINVESLEWLYLAVEGHRRARFSWDEAGGMRAEWRVP
jgi:hypothetical protein